MTNIEKRKVEHIKVCLEQHVETADTLFKDITLIHQTLSELTINDVDTSVTFLGKKLAMPLMITAMTGGAEESKEINKQLAKIADKKQIAFGLGSQRAMIEKPELTDTYRVRDVAKNVLLFGNIGIAQIKKYSSEQIGNALKIVGADALCVHLNSAQELFQYEGDFDFKDCLLHLEKLCKELKYPIVAKEVGNGISRETAIKLKKVGVSAIDVGGLGGTSWILIDSIRANRKCEHFEDWGIPTACSILESKVGLPLIATGGVRTGLDMAKSITLGADMCGICLPFLRILKKEGPEGVEKHIDHLQQELKMVMLLTGSKNIEELKKANYVLTGKLKEWNEYRKL